MTSRSCPASLIPLVAALWTATAAAQTQPHPLAGTWIAVDDGFPRLVGAGRLLPTEEILHIADDGRAESRLMIITGLDTHFLCMTGWGCSDMLSVRAAKAQLSGGSLVFADREETPEAAKITQQAQTLAVSLTLIATSAQWTATLGPDNRSARFEAGGATRHFARIDPERLRTLRAALAPIPVPYSTHWRCFLSNATADDAAFDALGGTRRKPGAWLEDYLTAAAELHRLNILAAAPMPGPGSDPALVRSAGMQVTNSFLGAGQPYPSTLAEQTRYRAVLLAISGAAILDDERLAMETARNVDPGFTGELGVTRAGVAALRKVLHDDSANDPDVRDAFCLNLKDSPPPRPQFDPFRDRVPN
jgi:hypothetical protein